MKKILVSLVLVFSLFFSFGNLQTNAEISKTQIVKIDNALENFFEKMHMYEYNIKVNKITKILNVIDNLKWIYKKPEVKEILDYIYDKIDLYIRKQTILEYYSLIGRWELKKAFSMKIIDVWDESFDKKKELENFKKIYDFWEKVEISLWWIERNINNNFYFKVEINYLNSNKIETYNVAMSVNPNTWMLPLLIKTINVEKYWVVEKEIEYFEYSTEKQDKNYNTNYNLKFKYPNNWWEIVYKSSEFPKIKIWNVFEISLNDNFIEDYKYKEIIKKSIKRIKQYRQKNSIHPDGGCYESFNNNFLFKCRKNWYISEIFDNFAVLSNWKNIYIINKLNSNILEKEFKKFIESFSVIKYISTLYYTYYSSSRSDEDDEWKTNNFAEYLHSINWAKFIKLIKEEKYDEVNNNLDLVNYNNKVYILYDKIGVIDERFLNIEFLYSEAKKDGVYILRKIKYNNSIYYTLEVLRMSAWHGETFDHTHLVYTMTYILDNSSENIKWLIQKVKDLDSERDLLKK